MTAFQIVTIIRALIDAGQSDDQIAATLQAMGFDQTVNPPAAESEPVNNPNAERIEALRAELAALENGEAVEAPTADTGNGRRTTNRESSVQPMVKYVTLPGITAQRLQSKLTGRQLQVATLILKAGKNGITKRDVRDTLKITNGAAMSAIHGLQTREIVKSIPIPGAQAPRLPRRTAATAPRTAVR